MLRGTFLLVVLAVMYLLLSKLTGQGPTMEGMLLMVGGSLLIRTFDLEDKLDRLIGEELKMEEEQ